MKKILVTLAALAGIAAPVAFIANPARAYTGDRCMTKAEWYQIRDGVWDEDYTVESPGMTRAEVTAIVGIPSNETYRYETSDGEIDVDVESAMAGQTGRLADATDLPVTNDLLDDDGMRSAVS